MRKMVLDAKFSPEFESPNGDPNTDVTELIPSGSCFFLFVSPHSAFWKLRKSHLGVDQPECFDLKDMSLRKHRVSSGKHVI